MSNDNWRWLKLSLYESKKRFLRMFLEKYYSSHLVLVIGANTEEKGHFHFSPTSKVVYVDEVEYSRAEITEVQRKYKSEDTFEQFEINPFIACSFIDISDTCENSFDLIVFDKAVCKYFDNRVVGGTGTLQTTQFSYWSIDTLTRFMKCLKDNDKSSIIFDLGRDCFANPYVTNTGTNNIDVMENDGKLFAYGAKIKANDSGYKSHRFSIQYLLFEKIALLFGYHLDDSSSNHNNIMTKKSLLKKIKFHDEGNPYYAKNPDYSGFMYPIYIQVSSEIIQPSPATPPRPLGSLWDPTPPPATPPPPPPPLLSSSRRGGGSGGQRRRKWGGNKVTTKKARAVAAAVSTGFILPSDAAISSSRF